MRKFLLSFLATLVVFPALADYKLVTDVSKLADGDKIIVVNTQSKKALSITQDSNNRPATDITIDNGSIASISDQVQIITLVANTEENGQFAFQVGDNAYLYAASSTKNYLRTQSEKTYASVDIASSGDATVIFQGSYTHNTLRYNTSSAIFACYTSGQQPVQIYKNIEDNRIKTSIAFNQEEYTLTLGVDRNIGDPFDPVLIMTPSDQNWGPINFMSSNEAVAKVEDDHFIIKGSGTTTLTASFEGDENFAPCEDTCNLTIIDPDVKKRFELVTGVDELSVGDKIVVVNSKSNPILTISPTPNTSQSSLKSVSSVIDVDVKDNQTIWVNTEDAAVFTIVNGTTDENGNTAKALQYQNGKILILSEAKPQGFSSSDNFDSTGNKSTDEKANVSFEIDQNNASAKIIFYEGRYIREYNKQDFRAYTKSETNSHDVYIYKIPVEKQDVVLSWDKTEYTYDMDFGWADGEPVLSVSPETVRVDDLTIKYSSSNEDVARISSAAASMAEINARKVGDTEISAVVDTSDKNYKSEEAATYTLHVVGVDAPMFADGEGNNFEENEIELLPSELAAGYTVKIKKAGDEYGVKVTLSPTASGKVEYTDEGAVVTVTKTCTITAITTKGEQTSTRRATFTIKMKELAPADIKWTSTRYVYDMATSHWDNTPQLTNTNNYPVVYNTSNPDVATISATGRVTPIAQGTAIVSATVEGTDKYGTTTETTTIRVTDSTAPAGYDVFEMVKKGDQLRENEQFIIVSGEPFNPEVSQGDATKDGQYYALSPYRYIDTSVKDYYEAVPIEFPDGDDSGERLMVSDDSYVLRLNKQFDTSADNPNYPFLFQVMNEDVDYNKDGVILDTDNPTVGSGNNERIYHRYIQVKREKYFSFVDLPENVEDRRMMNGNIRVLDPAEIEGYIEKDFHLEKNDEGHFKYPKVDFLNKGEIIFNGTDGQQHFVRFNPSDNAVHFNVYKLDNAYDQETRSKEQTFPIRIYRLANRVEKPSITVYPAEPVASETAYEGGQTYNNKVRVVIEQHPKTSKGAKLMRQWQAKGKNPALPDYEAFKENQITVFVDGNKVVDENDENLRYIDETRTLFAVSNLEDVYSESASATFNFKTAAPRISKPTKENGQITVRITRPANYTKDAVYYYVISEDNSKPSVKFNQDGSVISFNGTAIDPWTGTEEDTNGSVTFAEGETLWVGSFKSGYESTLVEYNNLTAFPECRPMQLLRLTDEGRELLLDPRDFNTENIFGGHYDKNKPLYINYRNDLVNEADGSIAESDNHYHYMIQRDHSYGSSNGRQVWIEQISEAQFKKIFGENFINVDDNHAKNFEWTSDFYVFALNEADFNKNFENLGEMTFDSPEVVTSDRTFTALENSFKRKPTNADGSYKEDATAETVKYYGAMMENQGKLGAKTITTQLKYYVGDERKEFNTETTAEVAPKIPSVYGFTYEYQYDRDEAPSLTEDNEDTEFVKLSVPSAVEGQGNSEVLIPINELNSRHLNLVFKFHRPNISKHILENYDIYYDIKFNRLDMTDEENPVRTLLAGSGVYMDTEKESDISDAVYRFRIDDVHPTSTIYPEIEISKVTYVGNSGTESYGQCLSNFGDQRTKAPAPNNSERTKSSIEEVQLAKVKDSEKEIDGKKYADWKYIGHKELNYTPDIIIGSTEPDKTITLESSFFHLETYVPGTDYYNSYEYLVKHDETTHINPFDENHPYFSDELYGKDKLPFDALRHTIIARDVPADENGNLIAPKIVISPVYFFAYGADMKPLTLDDDDKVIPDFTGTGGSATIVKVNDLPGAVSPTETGANNAPRRAEAEVKNAPTNQDYPMPHAGDTDMAHETILDLSHDPNYTVVYGGGVEADPVVIAEEEENQPNIVLSWGPHKESYKVGEQITLGIAPLETGNPLLDLYDGEEDLEIYVDGEYVELVKFDEEGVTLKFLKPTESTKDKIIARIIQPNEKGLFAEDAPLDLRIIPTNDLKLPFEVSERKSGSTEFVAAKITDWFEDGDYEWTDMDYQNSRYDVDVKWNSLLKFSCPSANKLKVETYLRTESNGYLPQERIERIIENNSYNQLIHTGINNAYVIVTPIAPGYDENGEYKEDFEYSDQRFHAKLIIDEGEALTRTLLTINLAEEGEDNIVAGASHYSNGNGAIMSEISKREEDGQVTRSDKGLVLKGNGWEDETPLHYDMNIKFKNPNLIEQAVKEGIFISDIEFKADNQVKLDEELDEFTFTGNSWNLYTSDGVIGTHGSGWKGISRDVSFTASNGNDATISQIEVTIAHNPVPKPVWVRASESSQTDANNWIGYMMLEGDDRDDHTYYYYYETKDASLTAPQRKYADGVTTHDEVMASGLSTDSKTAIQIPKDITYLHVFAEHPVGARSEVITMSNNDIKTGIDATIVDGGEERWYTMQGVEVKNPSEGVYIRVKNGHSEKVILK